MKISVIIPAYNRAGIIRDAITSVLTQSVTPYEIVIVDDCSTDNTSKIIDAINAPNIRYIKLNKQSGAQVARNIGINAAKGDWIAFNDSDDEWLPTKLEKQIESLKDVDYNIWTVLHSNFYIATENSKTLDLADYSDFNGVNVHAKLLEKRGTTFPSLLTSKAALKKINFLDENVLSFQEWDTSIALSKFCRFIYSHEPLFIYNQFYSDSISKDTANYIKGYQYIINKNRNDIVEICGGDAFDNHLICLVNYAIENGNYDVAYKLSSQIVNNESSTFIMLKKRIDELLKP